MQLNSMNRKGMKVLGIQLITLSIAVSGVFSESYPEPAVAGPASTPTFPAAFSAYNPPVGNDAVVAGAPVVAEWSRSNDPGDTMVLTGSELSCFSGDEVGRDTRFILFGYAASGSMVTDALIRRLDGKHAALTLPENQGLLPGSMYLLWPKNNKGLGAPIAINRTEAWWVGPDRIAAEELFSVYGRNLQLNNGSCYLYIEELDRWLESVSENPYKADFMLPSNIANGSYTIWMHNGSGGDYGWSKSLNLTVRSKVIWNSTVYNVKDFGAVGDGISDDADAISQAITAADSDKFSTVYFPAGTYAIAGRLPMKGKDSIRYMGAGINATTITLHPNHALTTDPHYLINNSSENSKFCDLAFEANQYGGDNLFYIRGNDNVTCENVRFSQLKSPSTIISYDVVDVHKTEYTTFKNCEFITTGRTFFGGARQVFLDGCDFYGLNDNNSIMSAWGGSEISILNSTGQCYDNSDSSDGFGWCKGRFFHSSGVWGSTRNVYFGGNATSDMTPRYDPQFGWYETGQVDQNSGEAFMCELQVVNWRTNVVASSANTLTLSAVIDDYVNDVMTIVAGKGFGQSREITAIDAGAGVVTVDEPWNVLPDSTSVVSIGTYTRRMIVYDNYFDGTERAISDTENNRNIAVAGVEPYGGATDWIVANNTFHQMRKGFDSFARFKDKSDQQNDYYGMPHYFNTVIGNRFISCRYAIKITVDKKEVGDGELVGELSYFGGIYRNNIISNAVKNAVIMSTYLPEAVFAMTIFEGNDIHTLDGCVSGVEGEGNQIWIQNKFTGNGSGNGIVISSGHIPVLRGNTWQNFSKDYGGSTPGSVLELPLRAIDLDATNSVGEVKILNSGTAALNWTASTTSPWITLSQATGTVSDENSEGAFVVEADLEAMPEENAEAVITVVSDTGQEQQMTVAFAAPPPPDGPPAPVLTSITISGASSVDEETQAQYICTAGFSDGSSAAVAPSWTEDSSYASISSTGVLTAEDVDADQNITVTANYSGLTDTHAVTLNYVAPTLTDIVISGPGGLNEETAEQYTCTANYSDGSSKTVTPSWSENSAHTTVNSSGVLTAGDVSADQNIVLSASYGGKTDTHAVLVSYVAPLLSGISISGATSVSEGSTAPYTCTASYSDGTSAVVTPSWSENSSYASINTSGLLTAGNLSADQNITVTATYGGKTDTHNVALLYAPPVLSGIVISGPSSVDEETTAQYICTASYSDGTSLTVTPVWTDNASHSSISASGLLTAGDISFNRNMTITATFGGKSDTHSVVVNYIAVVVTGITITGPASVNEETTGQYTCTASYSDGTSTTVTPTWSENSSKASISSAGVFTAENISADQNVIITASFGGQSDTQVVLVKYVAPVLSGITISGVASLDEETTAQYICTANYSDGTSLTVTPEWSENSSASTISGSGLLTTGDIESDQNITISASYGGKSDAHAVLINYIAPLLTTVVISGPSSLNEESTAQYTCTANYSDGTSAVVSPNWSENSSNASLNNSGLLTAGNISADESLTITASFDGKTDTHGVSLLYVQPTLTAVSITGPNRLDEETTAQYICTATYSDGTSASVIPVWSDNSSFASISSSGLLTAGNIDADKSFVLTAIYDGQSDSHPVQITFVAPPVVITGLVISGPSSIEENTNVQFSCTASYSDGSSSEVVPDWSENSAFASISASGLLSAGNVEANQNVTISAMFGGQTVGLSLAISVVDTQIIFPLSGFEGQTVYAELFDHTADEWLPLGDAFEPSEIVIEDVNPEQWYWLGISVYDEESSEPVLVHGSWIRM